MKKIKILSLALVAALNMGLVACASTPTQESTGQYVDDTAITTKVKAAFVNTPNLDSTAISVETYKGVVQLSGFVDSATQSQLASSTAAEVAGVQSVDNSLIVKPAGN